MAPTHVLFFAAIPPQDVADQIKAAWKAKGTQHEFREGKLHVTLLPLFAIRDFDAQTMGPRLASRLTKAFADLTLKGFDLTLDRLMTFGGSGRSRPQVLTIQGRCDAANDLARTLHIAVASMGLEIEKFRKVTPHLTLAYGDPFPETRVLDTSISWRVNEFSLIDSPQGMGQHIKLGTWQLTPPDANLGFWLH